VKTKDRLDVTGEDCGLFIQTDAWGLIERLVARYELEGKNCEREKVCRGEKLED